MKDLKSIEEKNIRKVSVPLEIAQIKEYFENKELFFLIDYSISKIKGNMFLTYISNLDLPCEIDLSGASKAERFELMKFYFETRNLNDSNVLRLSAAQIMLERKNFDTLPMFMNPVFTREECAEFISTHQGLIERWNTFLSSTMIFMLTVFQEIEATYSFKDQFKLVEDPHYIGSNVVQLFSVSGFLEHFFSVPADTEIFYFKNQFEEYMFRGKNLFYYFDAPENTLLHLFNEMLAGNKTQEEINSMLQGAT